VNIQDLQLATKLLICIVLLNANLFADTMIKNLEDMLTSSKLATENLNSELGELHLQLKVKDEEIIHHIVTQQNLDKEKSDLQLCNADLAEKLDMSLQEIKNLEGSLEEMATHLLNLDKESLNLMSKFDEMNSLYSSCFKLVQHERDTFSKHAQNQYDELHNKFLILSSEKDGIHMINQELSNSLNDLRKVQESNVAQYTEDCRLAAERIQRLESEAEALTSKKAEAEVTISKLEEKAEILLESVRSSENQMVYYF
jgi:synaptonemal complex protein 1